MNSHLQLKYTRGLALLIACLLHSNFSFAQALRQSSNWPTIQQFTVQYLPGIHTKSDAAGGERIITIDRFRQHATLLRVGDIIQSVQLAGRTYPIRNRNTYTWVVNALRNQQSVVLNILRPTGQQRYQRIAVDFSQVNKSKRNDSNAWGNADSWSNNRISSGWSDSNDWSNKNGFGPNGYYGNRPVTGSPVTGFPQFPWPPPRASSTETVPRNMLIRRDVASTSLQDVNKSLIEALQTNGYYDSSYYAIPNGFALVTRIEQIDDAGNSKTGNARWSLERQPLQKFSLRGYLSALFGSDPGKYRVIVFAVTPADFVQSTESVSSNEAELWLSGGLTRLPRALGEISFGQNHACTALIYEFHRPSENAQPSLAKPGLPGRVHMTKSGLLGSLSQ